MEPEEPVVQGSDMWHVSLGFAEDNGSCRVYAEQVLALNM